MKNGERHGIFTDDNYGGRKGRAAMDAVMKRYFILSAIHLERRNCAYTDCDATAYYDRIIPAIQTLYHKVGVPIETARWLNKALQQMEYHMSTEFGESMEYNTSTRD